MIEPQGDGKHKKYNLAAQIPILRRRPITQEKSWKLWCIRNKVWEKGPSASGFCQFSEFFSKPPPVAPEKKFKDEKGIKKS